MKSNPAARMSKSQRQAWYRELSAEFGARQPPKAMLSHLSKADRAKKYEQMREKFGAASERGASMHSPKKWTAVDEARLREDIELAEAIPSISSNWRSVAAFVRGRMLADALSEP